MAEFYFKSNGKFIVTVENGYLRWKRKGFQNYLNQGSKGEKSIPIKSITAIQIKEPRLTTGYIQFAYSGASESKGGVLDAVKDENTITFLKKELDQAIELKNLLETLQNEDNSVITKSSDAEELIKYKQLLDDGILTQDEFDAKKKQILGL
ncbi:DUF4429 domain-containing protein [Oceanobacillus profundus]|uniref:DUF4429 domain-containing protein n=1 Tax=Oceanobacillus TaxID=182709 RepID=UPI00203E3853|nr:DUF4429 domain-containing protein [Oceanobacillus profundus]MBR3120658.1 SHOCT domain-containing protein [Oceanobacillus sp.]MCM3399184.1 DUF4429 domain-containing protein [Oceanobacillus profundus]MDO6449216.1 SHOCT domain-containing protein [Oceanobacillus profundus]